MRRRRFLALAGAGLMAGCTGNGDTGTEQPSIDEVKDEAQFIEYNDLMRNSDDYIDEYVHFPDGQIQQVLGNKDEGFQFRVFVTEEEYSWEDDIAVRWDGERFIEDDIIEVWGRFNGLITYETVLGSERTIPDVTARDINLKQEG